MAPRGGRRHAPVDEEEEVTPPPTQTQRNRRRDDTPDEDEDVDMEDTQPDNGSGSIEQLSKGLVRYALACEHARKPIKRQDINEKVLGSHTRLFNVVFSSANSQLMDVFGMQLVELPKADKVTMRQKRAGAASNSQSTTTGMWVLQTILPEQYRIPEIIGPSRPLDADTINREDAYVGLYTFVIALITISGGILSEAKLDRYLRRMEAERNTPLGTKDKTLALMVKDGYIVKVKESSGGEEMIEYIVGPRGKVEVGRDGVANLVRTMYGDSVPEGDLDKAIQRTLDIADASSNSAPAGEAAVPSASVSQVAGRKRGRPRNDGEDE